MMITAKVSSVRVVIPNAETAAAQMMTSTRRHFSWRSSTAKSSKRFWTMANPPSRILRTEAKTPPGLCVSSFMASPACDQHADEHADAEGHSDGFIRMIANDSVGRLGSFDRLFFQAAAGGLGRFECRGQTFAHFVSLFAHRSGGALEQLLGVAHDPF